jgi:hypothetical protein
MADQFRSTFHKKLAKFVSEECFDETELRIFDVFIEEEYSMSLEELVIRVFGEAPKDDGDTEYNKADEGRQVREGIRAMQRLAVPILQSKDGDYYLGDDEDSIEVLIGSVETEIELLQEQYGWMNFNSGRMLERLGQ